MAFVPHGVVLICLINFLHQTSGGTIGPNTTEIQCEDGKEGCSECYITFVKYVVYNDTNVFELGRAFLPPTKQEPVFVRVTYHFETAEDVTWYWTSETSTFLHPIQGFQFFSLLFSNYDWLTGKVNVTMPDECAEASDEYFELLTQRLKTYVLLSSGDIAPIVGVTSDYDANSANDKTLKELHVNTALVWTLYLYQAFIPLVVFIVARQVVCAKYMKQKIINFFPDEKGEWNGWVYSLAVLAIIQVLFAVIMDLVGIVETAKLLYYKNTTSSPLINILRLPMSILFIWDLIIFAVTTIALLWSKIKDLWLKVKSCCKSEQPEENNPLLPKPTEDKNTKNISISLVAIITMVSNHSYYIIVALINDPDHATSVGLYFAAVIALYLFSLYWFWKTLINKIMDVDSEKNTKCKKFCSFISTCIFVVAVFAVLALVTAVYVYIPIKHSSEDIPKQINSIAHTLTAIFTGLIFYILKDNNPNQADQKQNEQINTTLKFMEKCLRKINRQNILSPTYWLEDSEIVEAMELMSKETKSGNIEVCMTDRLKRNGGVQILHTGGNHWITIKSEAVDKNTNVIIFDRRKPTSGEPTEETKGNILSLLKTKDSQTTFTYANVQQQAESSDSDCGLFAIAFAMELCKGHTKEQLEAKQFDTGGMRKHLVDCLNTKKMTPFPTKKST